MPFPTTPPPLSLLSIWQSILIFENVSSVAQSCPTRCDPIDCSLPVFPVHHQFPELTQTHVHWVSDAIQPSHHLSSPSLPAFNLPSIIVFSNESVLPIRWPKYWSFSFNISPSNEYSGFISFRMDWQSKRLSRVFSNTTVQKHQFFSTQLYSPTLISIHDFWKNHTLTRWTFVGKVMSLLFKML